MNSTTLLKATGTLAATAGKATTGTFTGGAVSVSPGNELTFISGGLVGLFVMVFL
jgi:hypothetical protein